MVSVIVAATFAVAGLASCGIAGGSPSLGPTTTRAVSQATLAIDPPEGPIGTVFTLAASGMTPGDAVQFEITFPADGRAYPGNALVVADDGTASATYRATTANVPGDYSVRLTGPQGQLATGQFRVTDGKPLVSTTTTRSSTSTSGSKASTPPKSTAPGAKPTTTTAKASSTSTRPTAPAPRGSSTTRPSTTPPTTAPATTLSPPPSR